VQVLYATGRVQCKGCAHEYADAVPWVGGKQPFGPALMVTLTTCARTLRFNQVAPPLPHYSWDTVNNAVVAAVTYGLALRDLSTVIVVAIYESSRKKGRLYVTNAYDLKRKCLLWSREALMEQTLEAVFGFLSPDRAAAIQGNCCDTWQPSIDVIKTRVPHEVLVFDKFHIVRRVMGIVGRVRRYEIRVKGQAHNNLMHRARRIRLKNTWNPTKRRSFRVGRLEQLNLKINRAIGAKSRYKNSGATRDWFGRGDFRLSDSGASTIPNCHRFGTLPRRSSACKGLRAQHRKVIHAEPVALHRRSVTTRNHAYIPVYGNRKHMS